MPHFESKICPRDELIARAKQLPQPLVLTNGVFDILHRGHASYLADARARGGSLIVAVNSDDSARRLGKGQGPTGVPRPINACADRMALLAALASVDLVTSFDEDTAREVIELVRPDIYIKGGDYVVEQTPEGAAVLGYGGKVAAIAFVHDRSTTKLLDRIRATMAAPVSIKLTARPESASQHAGKRK